VVASRYGGAENSNVTISSVGPIELDGLDEEDSLETDEDSVELEELTDDPLDSVETDDPLDSVETDDPLDSVETEETEEIEDDPLDPVDIEELIEDPLDKLE
jgi:hypothetical protein